MARVLRAHDLGFVWFHAQSYLYADEALALVRSGLCDARFVTSLVVKQRRGAAADFLAEALANLPAVERVRFAGRPRRAPKQLARAAAVKDDGGDGDSRAAAALADDGWRDRARCLAALRAGCPGLRDLAVEGCFDVSALAGCGALARLDLSNSWILRNVDAVAALPSLVTLSLELTSVDDVGPLAACALLEDLDLRRSNVEDVAPLAACARLRVFKHRNVHFSDVAPLAACPRLEHVDCDGCGVVDAAPLRACERLAYVDLGASMPAKLAGTDLRAVLPRVAVFKWECRETQKALEARVMLPPDPLRHLRLLSACRA